MRKISWLSWGCVAACVVPLIAADNSGMLTSKDSTNGRSRLLIFSRNKTKVRTEDEEPAGVTRLSSPAEEDESEEAPIRNTVRSGNTGTVSPRKQASRPTVPTTSRPAPAQREIEPLDDELARKLFESDELDRQEAEVARQAATRPARSSQAAVEKHTSTKSVNEASAPVTASPKTNTRYKDLLESVRPGPEHTASRKENAKTDAIRPVSRTTDENLEFEVNPFEPSERPSKVVNAGFESDSGRKASRVKPVSSISTSKLAPAAKGTKSIAPPKAAQQAAPAKPVYKPVTVVVKPAGSPAVSAPSAPIASTAGGNQTPQVDVKWEARGEVNLGQECQCALVVTNSGKIPCRDLVVEANFPESVRLVDSHPFPQPGSSKLEWNFTDLPAGETKTIELTIIPTKPGELAASAQVRFTGTAATSFKVSEPLLNASIKLPSEVRIGDPTSATVTVSNPGTGTVKDVVLKATLPVGLDCKTGRDFVSEIGPLGPGESRAVRIAMVAIEGGDHTLKVLAQSTDSDLEQSSQTSIRVLAPSLTLSASGPSLRYLNRAARYTLTATNNSNASSDNVRISQTIPAGFDFVKADQSGRWDAERRTVTWFIGQMQPGQSKTVDLELLPREIGEFRQQFRVTGDAGVEAASVVTTRVEGAASLVMEVKDTEDPIEIGSNMTYAISVRNEGSKSAGKVAVSCELPPDVELVDVDGPTQHLVESGMLIFKPVPQLSANDSVTFRITIKGTAAGNMKLRARMTSESIQKPLIVEEATQFYAE